MTVAIVWANVAFLAGAVVLIVLCSSILALRHRTPRSIEATVESFSRGMQALSPDAAERRHARRRGGRPAGTVARPQLPPAVRTTLPGPPEAAGRPAEAEAG